MSDVPPTPTESTTPPTNLRRLRKLLVRRDEAAELCSVGLATWDRMTAAGQNPAPTKLSGCVVWSVAQLREWSRHGCPPRAEWEPLWAALAQARRRRP